MLYNKYNFLIIFALLVSILLISGCQSNNIEKSNDNRVSSQVTRTTPSCH